jgi:hypothetical protein
LFTKIERIAPAMTLQSVLMTPCVLVRGRKPNAYGMLVGHPSRGKGTNTTALEDVLGILQRDLIDISSTKSLLKRGIGPNPWGCQIINEFEQFLKANYFLNDSMKMLIDL